MALPEADAVLLVEPAAGVGLAGELDPVLELLEQAAAASPSASRPTISWVLDLRLELRTSPPL
jgi:hypothetical protein